MEETTYELYEEAIKDKDARIADLERERDELKFLLERSNKRLRDKNEMVCGVVHAKRQLGLIGPQMKRPFFKEIWPQVMAFIKAHGGIDIK